MYNAYVRGCDMSVTSEIIRGHTDTVILANLLCRDSYGYEINKAIKRGTGGQYELNEATLYTAFRRLEEAGCITSYWGSEPNRARRKYYHITEHGREVYQKRLEDWKAARDMIDQLIGAEDAK